MDEGDIQSCRATFCDAVIASDRLRTLLTARERAAFGWRAAVLQPVTEPLAVEPLEFQSRRDRNGSLRYDD